GHLLGAEGEAASLGGDLDLHRTAAAAGDGPLPLGGLVEGRPALQCEVHRAGGFGGVLLRLVGPRRQAAQREGDEEDRAGEQDRDDGTEAAALVGLSSRHPILPRRPWPLLRRTTW